MDKAARCTLSRHRTYFLAACLSFWRAFQRCRHRAFIQTHCQTSTETGRGLAGMMLRNMPYASYVRPFSVVAHAAQPAGGRDRHTSLLQPARRLLLELQPAKALLARGCRSCHTPHKQSPPLSLSPSTTYPGTSNEATRSHI
jgi:hypothetical protein